jgi:aerobic carbon-monoxide dehydrogenase large subunit
MTQVMDPAKFPDLKFGVGQSVSRKEDPRLLRGDGLFTDDLNLPDQAYGIVVRSPYPHAVLKAVETADALAAPGVLAVYTGSDMAAAGYGHHLFRMAVKNRDGSDVFAPPWAPLAIDKVRHVGEAFAFVVAETRAQAKDAAELVIADVETLPAVIDPEAAAAPNAPRLYDEGPNLCADWQYGDADAIDKIFAGAAHVTRRHMVQNRLVVAAMEPRAAIAEYDAGTDRLTLHLGSQGVFPLQRSLAQNILKVDAERLRVMTYDVGGSFGMKSSPYPEYTPLMHAAKHLGRPVKWCDERVESFVSDHHGRDAAMDGEMALDADGNVLAVRLKGVANMGAHLTSFGPYVPTVSISKNLPSLYRIPAIAIETRCVLTNTTPTGTYRGAGRPEAIYYTERLIDAAAREIGRDPVDLRRQNMIPPDAIPYTSASGMEYDSGEFEGVLDDALARADWAGFENRRTAANGRGIWRGIGLCCYLEASAGGAGEEMGGIQFLDDGRVRMVTGTLNYGQGHSSTYAQILVDRLGIPFQVIELLQGDSDQLIAGGGTGGSRSTLTSSTALIKASDAVIENGRALAGHFLEAAAGDIEFADGTFRVVGTDREIPILELAARTRSATGLPDTLPTSLDVAEIADVPPPTFPNGCHIAEVEVDPETGVSRTVAYTAVDDFGTLVNPALVEGQLHGGVVQGIGQALFEEARYSTDGALLTGSFMDYALPRADQTPPTIDFASHPVPATTNTLGVKGCGEASITGALPAVMNALLDALAPHGVTHLNMPATPETVWRAINGEEIARRD